jgi:gamma-glutamylcyclotransferase (GGCT)/AIG2-like uncharacterized protein YtfP
MEYLFIYGTLMRTFAHPMHWVLESYAEFMGEAKVRGRLYEIDDYPGLVVTDKEFFVEGELYRVHTPEPLFTELDRYEECSPEFPQPHEYLRLMREVFLKEGGTINAWIYCYNHPVDPAKLIASGRYTIREAQKI